MHGETEVYENLRQFVIQEQYPDKIVPYLKEFLVAGDSEAALAAVGLSSADLASDIAAADDQYSITKNLEDESSWSGGKYPQFNTNTTENEQYSVQGSPTLVINGKVMEGVNRTPAALLTAICSAFNTEPEACGVTLSTEIPTSGFGYGDSTSASAGGECS
jgi:hypothetical protein